MSKPAEPATITPCPDGPLLVRGDFTVLTAPGREETASDRRVVALCRCGKTGIPPLRRRPSRGRLPCARTAGSRTFLGRRIARADEHTVD